MCAAESFPVCHVADIGFHVGGTMSEDEIHHVFFGFLFNIAEWTFSGICHGV